MGLQVNKKELAEIVGATERTLTEWQKHSSFPIEHEGQRGQSNIYDTAKVVQWMIQRALAGKSKESQRERRDRLQGDKIELEIAKECGTLIDAQEYESELSGLVYGVRNTILQGDSTLKMQLDSLYGIDIDIEVLNEHTRSILEQLAAYAQEYEEDDSEVSA